MTEPDDRVLPDMTSDEQDVGWGDRDPAYDEDDRLLRDVPPHHTDRD